MATIRFHLQSVPAYTPAGSLYLAGSFNDWQPADPAFEFRRQADGTYTLSFETERPTLACKVTRGVWDRAEGDAYGQPLADRLFKAGVGTNEYWLHVASWTDLSHEAGRPTASDNVVVLHPHFYMPQLDRHRRIRAYLPPDYWTSRRRYPVLYMQDGQNLFDAHGAYSGEWGVDKALNRLFLQRAPATPASLGEPPLQLSAIVIGIENGGPHRVDEYSPWRHPEHGGGEGAAYLEFVCTTLKPFVDEHLRTLPGRETTGVLGSSMGGLFALYAALERPDVFGMAGVFSPSLWFAPAVFRLAATRRPAPPVRLLLMAGQRESERMAADLLDLYETLLGAGHPDEYLHYDLHSDGTHAEWFWAREFEHALRWLFGDEPGHRDGAASNESIRFRLDEPEKQLLVEVDPRLSGPVLEVRDYCHERHWRHPLRPGINRIAYREWENCLYAIRLHAAGDLVFSRRVHLNRVEPVFDEALA